MIKIFNIVFLSLLLLPSFCFSAPAPTSAPGAWEHGGSKVISGSGFGAKATVAPLKYDNFEGGAVDDDLTGWSTFAGGSPAIEPKYSDTQTRYSGSQSVHQNYTGSQYTCRISLTSLNERYIYFSGWFYTITSGDASRNTKFVNMGHGSASAGFGWQTRIDQAPAGTPPTGHMYAHDANCDGTNYTNHQDYGYGPSLYEDGWHRVDGWLDIGTANGSNGYRDISIDLDEKASLSGNFIKDSCNIEYVYIGHYYSHTPGGDMERWWDEIYIDNTRARVEIGNADTWEGCTHREIQIPTAWATDEITVTANIGPFGEGVFWLYVVDEDGLVNSSGLSITIGDAAPDIEPPYITSWTPEKSATGVLPGVDIVWELYDAISGVDISTISVVVESVTYDCDDTELTCSGTSAHYTVTYNNVGNFAYSQEVNWTFDASDLTPNAMDQDSGLFTIMSEPSSITRNVGPGGGKIITVGDKEVKIN